MPPTHAPPWTELIGRVTHGDCLDILASIPDGVVDAAFLDPPYNLDIDYADHDDAMGREDYLRWSARWLAECVRVLKPGGHLFVMISDEQVAELKVLAEGKYGLAVSTGEVIRRAGRPLHHRHIIEWYFTFGMNCAKRLSRSHAHILHFVGHRERHTWNTDAVRVPSARATLYGDKRASPAGRLPDDTWILRPADPDGFAPDHDVWHFNRVCGTYKEKAKASAPNQIPEQLVARALRLSTNPGDLVLDPFGGTFTTAAVAQKLGRRWISCELSADYIPQGMLRLESAQPGAMLDRPDAVAPPPAPPRRAKVRQL